MHILSTNLRDEFLAVPQLLRSTYALTGDELVPALIVKASSMNLKRLVMNPIIRVLIARMKSGRILYAVEVPEDEGSASLIWSWADSQEELESLKAIVSGGARQIHLFNELAINVASSEEPYWGPEGESIDLIGDELVTAGDPRGDDEGRMHLFSALVAGSCQGIPFDVISYDAPGPRWVENFAHAAGNPMNDFISLFHVDEGGQQEQLALWLAQSLHSFAIRAPQVHTGAKSRELTDVLLNYAGGCFLIESKVLSILGRDSVPSRPRLIKTVSKHMTKAMNQLSGAIRSLKSGLTVVDSSGNAIPIATDQPAHAIILIPDLDLVTSSIASSFEVIAQFATDTGSYLHFLDPSELLRMVQVASEVSNRNSKISNIEALDGYLIQRWKIANEIDRSVFELIGHIDERGSLKLRVSVRESC